MWNRTRERAERLCADLGGRVSTACLRRRTCSSTRRQSACTLTTIRSRHCRSTPMTSADTHASSTSHTRRARPSSSSPHARPEPRWWTDLTFSSDKAPAASDAGQGGLPPSTSSPPPPAGAPRHAPARVVHDVPVVEPAAPPTGDAAATFDPFAKRDASTALPPEWAAMHSDAASDAPGSAGGLNDSDCRSEPEVRQRAAVPLHPLPSEGATAARRRRNARSGSPAGGLERRHVPQRSVAASAASSTTCSSTLGFATARARRRGRRDRARIGAPLGPRADRTGRHHRGPARPRDRRALRPRPPRPDRLPGRHGGSEPDRLGGGEALRGGPGRLRRRPHAARRDGRSGERAGGRRPRDADALRRAAGGRLLGGHRRVDRAAGPLRRLRPRGGRRGRARTRTTARSSSCTSRPTTPRSSSSSTRSSRRRRSAAPPTSTSSPTAATCACASASTAC